MREASSGSPHAACNTVERKSSLAVHGPPSVTIILLDKTFDEVPRPPCAEVPGDGRPRTANVKVGPIISMHATAP